MFTTRLSKNILRLTDDFIGYTAKAWMDHGIVTTNSYGVQLLIASRPGGDFSDGAVRAFGLTLPNTEHDEHWYIANASGKNLICLETNMDSHEAIATWPGLVRQIKGAFPWPGAVIDLHYGLCIGTSGFDGDEDLMFSRAIRNFIVMHLDREGKLVLDDAAARGELEGEAGADRFTRGMSLE